MELPRKKKVNDPCLSPDYIRISNDIEAAIRSGERPPHSKLPTIAELRKLYDVGETTVKFALVRLEARHLIYRHQGKGTFVAENPPRCDAKEGS